MNLGNPDLSLIAINQRGRIKNHFSLETKQCALKRIFWDRQPIAYVARDIGVSESTVRGWCRVSEKILEPQNDVSNMPPLMDPRQQQLYNNYHFNHQMYYSQFAQPYFQYQQVQHIELEMPPLMPPPSYYQNRQDNTKHPTKLDPVPKIPTDTPLEKPKTDDRTGAIEAGEVFLAWISTCPEFMSSPNLKVLQGTIERLKNYTPLEKKKKDGILNSTRRRK